MRNIGNGKIAAYWVCGYIKLSCLNCLTPEEAKDFHDETISEDVVFVSEAKERSYFCGRRKRRIR